MLFGKLFGRSRYTASAPAQPETPRPSPGPQAVPPPQSTQPITETERQEYGYLREAVTWCGIDKLTTPGIRELMASPLADEAAQLRRVVDHPNFRTALHQMADHADAEEEQMQLLKNLMADMKEYGRDGFVSAGLQSVLKDKSGSGRDYMRRIFAHPDAYPTIRRYEAHRERLEQEQAQVDEFTAYIEEVERDAFGDPNRMLTYTDTRPSNWEGVRYRHVAHYRRIAGTMSDREKFVYLMAHATRFYFNRGMDDDAVQNEFALRVVCALHGGGRGEQDWQVDPGYRGDNPEAMLPHAKERFDPWPVDKYFNHGAKVILDMHAQSPDLPIVRWGMKWLRPHSAGWATSR